MRVKTATPKAEPGPAADRDATRWEASEYLGASPAWHLPHIAIEAAFPGAQGPRPRLLAASLAIARQLLKEGAAPLWLGAAVDAVAAASREANPWSCWVEAMLAARLERCPVMVERRGTGALLRIALPYAPVAIQFARLARNLLVLADRLERRGSVRAGAAGWRQGFDTLDRLLPDAGVLALHRALRDARVPFLWAGGDVTYAGWGTFRRKLIGDGGDPRRSADALAGACRIPLYSVTGSVGKTTTVRLLAQLLEAAGHPLGLADSGGLSVAGRRIREGDAIGGGPVRRLLFEPEVGTAVVEIGRLGLIKKGVPYDRSASACSADPRPIAAIRTNPVCCSIPMSTSSSVSTGRTPICCRARSRAPAGARFRGKWRPRSPTGTGQKG